MVFSEYINRCKFSIDCAIKYINGHEWPIDGV